MRKERKMEEKKGERGGEVRRKRAGVKRKNVGGRKEEFKKNE